MSLITIFGSIDQGLIFGILSLGLYVAFRILDLPDLTVDGSFVTGLAVSGMFALNGHPYLGVLFAIIAGFFAGAFTGLLHTKFNIQPILAGILTMTALYSINLKIMGLKPSIIFYGKETVFSFMEGRFSISGIDVGKGVLLLIITLIITGLLYWFLQTQIGLSLRATGDNEVMVRSSSINTDLMKIIGFGICNALVGLSGAVYIQYNQQASYTVGTGMLVLSLASIIIGEALFSTKTLIRHLISIVLGSIVYRIFIAIAFQLGLASSDLKLFSAAIVITAISVPQVKPLLNKWRKAHA
jgi:putative ABC transport system permease protein